MRLSPFFRHHVHFYVLSNSLTICLIKLTLNIDLVFLHEQIFPECRVKDATGLTVNLHNLQSFRANLMSDSLVKERKQSG